MKKKPVTIKCQECADGVYREKRGPLKVHDENGQLQATKKKLEYMKCDICGDVLLPLATCRILDKELDKQRQRITGGYFLDKILGNS